MNKIAKAFTGVRTDLERQLDDIQPTDPRDAAVYQEQLIDLLWLLEDRLQAASVGHKEKARGK